MLQVYIGFDPREEIAFHVLEHSIMERCSAPVSIAPLDKRKLAQIYTRPRGPTESTEFALTRFLVPLLSEFRGWSLFMDCDMLCRADITELFAYAQRQAEKAVLVCKHDYVPKSARKFLNQVQTAYPRKNWSSLMLFNNERCRALSADYVNRATGLDLHRFAWVDEALIGSLPLEWNWLVDEYAYRADARIVHFTRGGPWFPEFQHVDYADEWRRERDATGYAG
jgi:hypothetical protein